MSNFEEYLEEHRDNAAEFFSMSPDELSFELIDSYHEMALGAVPDEFLESD